MIDLANTAAIGITCAAGGFIAGAWWRGPAGLPAVSDDWHTIARLTDEVEHERKENDILQAEYVALDAENADLRKRLSDAGLQCTGGVADD